MPVTESNHYTRAEQHLKELTAMCEQEVSVKEMSRRLGIRREAITTVLTVAGVIPSTEGRDRVLEYVRANQGVSIDDVSGALDVPKATVSRYLRGAPEQRMIVTRKEKDYLTYSDVQKKKALKECWKLIDKEQKMKGLSRTRYDQLLGHQPDRPSSMSFIRRWGSWSVACQEAGISAAVARRSNYELEFADEDILNAINEYIEETSQTSFHPYSVWARENGYASGPLVVVRFGSWSNARRTALKHAESVA